MSTVNLTVTKETFARLQSYAVPLVDTLETVLHRLCDHYDANPPPTDGKKRYVIDMPLMPPEPTTFKTSRGVVLPAPLPLYARYDGNVIRIQLTTRGFEWEGRRFSDPSSVAVEVKKSLGASDTTASTNGWKFWFVGDGDPSKPDANSLDSLRQAWLDGEAARNRHRKSLAARLA